MHANISELLAARNGELGLTTSHIVECKVCQQEMKKLDFISAQLQELTAQHQPQTAWKDIVSVYKNQPQQSALQKTLSLPRAIYALAASVLVVGFTAIINFNPVPTTQVDKLLVELQAESKALEYVLSNYPLNESKLSAMQSFKVEQLQWQLIMLDRRLMDMQPEQNIKQLEALWSTRIKHLNTMHATYTSKTPSSTSHDQRDLL